MLLAHSKLFTSTPDATLIFVFDVLPSRVNSSS